MWLADDVVEGLGTVLAVESLVLHLVVEFHRTSIR
jgi:hypothetical protein